MHQVRSRGFTLIEVTVSVTVLSVLLVGVLAAIGSSSETFATGTTVSALNTQSRHALDKICDILKDSSLNYVYPAPRAPFNTEVIDLQRYGVQQSETQTWGNLERIGLEDGRIVWVSNLGLANQQTRWLCSGVSEYLEGEEPNGRDDNGNGLIDERGLSFDFDGNSVTVRLSLQRYDHQKNRIIRTVKRTVAFRYKD
jgi:prepilin-type N-terminal cleavage/methylation domain-containing protein